MVLLILASLPTPAVAAASTPTGLAATAVTPTTVSLTWQAVTNAPKYRVQYAVKPSMVGARYRRSTGSRVEIRGLEPRTIYYVKVRVITRQGKNLSPYSKAIMVTTPEAQLRIASYNVKCANCFSGLPDEQPWTERRSTLVAAIRQQDPDVIGIQEASQGRLRDARGRLLRRSQFEDLQRRLGSPWRLTNDKRYNCARSTSSTRCHYHDQGASQGTRIVYNSARVQMLTSGSRLLPSKGGTSNSRYLAWAILRQRSTGSTFFFANTHLQPGKDEYDLRRAEAEAAVRTIADRNRADLPVIAVGDFNSSRFANPTNAPYDVFTGAGFTDPIGNAARSIRAVDPTAELALGTWLNSFNGFVRRAKGNRSWDNGSYIDYMLTTPMRVSEWETVARLDSNDDFVGTIPSDHNLIRMTVYLPQ
jgi:endonuclease/exonuclease/phosphatase family metal-dependent hydrolase